MLTGVLGLALSVLPKVRVSLHQYKGRKQNETGLDITVYESAGEITASVQPIDRARYEYMGLDDSKNYIQLYTFGSLSPMAGNDGADYVVWQGRKWEVMKDTDWRHMSDFKGAMCVDVGAVDAGPVDEMDEAQNAREGNNG